MNMKDTYQTKDLPEASFLYASGKKLTSIDNRHGKVWFIFISRSSCEKKNKVLQEGKDVKGGSAKEESLVKLKGNTSSSKEINNMDAWERMIACLYHVASK